MSRIRRQSSPLLRRKSNQSNRLSLSNNGDVNFNLSFENCQFGPNNTMTVTGVDSEDFNELKEEVHELREDVLDNDGAIEFNRERLDNVEKATKKQYEHLQQIQQSQARMEQRMQQFQEELKLKQNRCATPEPLSLNICGPYGTAPFILKVKGTETVGCLEKHITRKIRPLKMLERVRVISHSRGEAFSKPWMMMDPHESLTFNKIKSGDTVKFEIIGS